MLSQACKNDIVLARLVVGRSRIKPLTIIPKVQVSFNTLLYVLSCSEP